MYKTTKHNAADKNVGTYKLKRFFSLSLFGTRKIITQRAPSIIHIITRRTLMRLFEKFTVTSTYS